MDADELTVESIVTLLTLVRADLAAELDGDLAPEQLLDRLVHLATRLVPGADDAGIALLTEDGPRTVAAVCDTAPAADDIQRALGSGPSFQVRADGQTLRIADLSADPRWPGLGERATDIGACSLLVCSLPMARKGPGVFSLYSDRPNAFDAAAELVVPVFAARAAIAIAYADKVVNLQHAIESRQVIGQAVGIMMERHRLTSKQAFEVLVHASQRSHLKLREIARRVTESGEEPYTAATRT